MLWGWEYKWRASDGVSECSLWFWCFEETKVEIFRGKNSGKGGERSIDGAVEVGDGVWKGGGLRRGGGVVLFLVFFWGFFVRIWVFVDEFLWRFMGLR